MAENGTRMVVLQAPADCAEPPSIAAEDEPKKGRWGGWRAGAGRKVSTLLGLLRQLPEDLGQELIFELHIAVVRIAAAGPRRQAMVRAVITALRQATEAADEGPDRI